MGTQLTFGQAKVSGAARPRHQRWLTERREKLDRKREVEALAEMLREAEAAHGEYEKTVLGGKRDENWADWYAEFIVNLMEEL